MPFSFKQQGAGPPGLLLRLVPGKRPPRWRGNQGRHDEGGRGGRGGKASRQARKLRKDFAHFVDV